MLKDPVDIIRTISALNRELLYREETQADIEAAGALWRQWHEAVATGAH